jgi:hypothetical protein
MDGDIYLTEVEVLAGNLARARAHAEEGLAVAEQGTPSMGEAARMRSNRLAARSGSARLSA